MLRAAGKQSFQLSDQPLFLTSLVTVSCGLVTYEIMDKSVGNKLPSQGDWGLTLRQGVKLGHLEENSKQVARRGSLDIW